MYDFPLLSLLLAPLLVAQGAYTKKITPRLPEPSGPRAGFAGQGPSLSLMIVGDSAAAGVGVSHQTEALSGHLGQKLAQYYEVSWRLIATSGHSTTDTIKALTNIDAFNAEIAVISLGVNDVVQMRYSKTWIQHQHQLRRLLINKFGCRKLIYSSVPPMHLFSAMPQPLRWFMGKRAGRFNEQLGAFIAADPHSELISLPARRDASFLASDGFHPSARTYAMWSDAIMDAILK
ncbi:MAG: SGNH/GDSL hydrolase family protein [Hahellaceae bacterium]|nr:SGNH/GDSL hydrolase family protein [Hahellaceae bacterium]MCP5168247.1 SGNH/GDSL hydrolase family protein [Hahellaceae bacterium]